MKYIKSLLAIATVALLGSSAWAALEADPSSVEVEVGRQKTVTIKNTSADNTYTLFLNTTEGPASTSYSDDFFSASVPSSTLGPGKTCQLTIEGKGVTDSPKTFTIYRGDKISSGVKVEIRITVTEPPAPQWTAVPLKDVQFVSATYITRTAGAKTVAKREAFATEEGCKYAWGKDDQPLTAWTDESDGTPCDLARPAEAAQLLVIGAK